MQFERYRQLMNSQYYNEHANANFSQPRATTEQVDYAPPPPFTYAMQQQNYYKSMRTQQMNPQMRTGGDAFNMSFNPGMTGAAPGQMPMQ